MKVVILAGGLGTRLSEETGFKPKPMVEIGGKPILWHIMKIYSFYGFNEFIICCGYKQYVIKEYFANYFYHNCDMLVDLSNNSTSVLNNNSENWKVTMIDTGLNTMTGSRLKRVQKYVGRERFLLTYGDGVTNLDIADTIKEHEKKGGLISLTAYQPSGRFGALDMDNSNSRVREFQEKPIGDGHWINAGYFVCEPEVFDFIAENDDNIVLEREPLENLAKEGKMFAYKHHGFWRPMDVMKDNMDLNKMWNEGNAPWKIW